MNIAIEPVPDPDTDFPQVPIGHYWEVVRSTDEDIRSGKDYPKNFLIVRLMGPGDEVLGSSDMTKYDGDYYAYWKKVEPTKDNAILKACSIYKSWASRVVEKHNEDQLIGVYNKR